MTVDIDYRALPPVEPVRTPARLSTTLLQKDDRCPRSAYLAVRHRGGPGSHQMDRGTLFHLVGQRAMAELMLRQEPAFAPDDPEQAAAIMHAFVDECLREHPELVVPRAEVDAVRQMAFHWAVGYDVNPEDVAGLERLMVLDLDCGVTVSGRLDVIVFPSLELGQVDDYKTSHALPAQEEYESDLQAWIYAVLLCFGVTVDRLSCFNCNAGAAEVEGGCPVCGGKGSYEERGEQIGGHLKGVLAREVYPRPKLRDDGRLHHRELLLSRTQIADFKADLERQAERLMARFESLDFPARSGSWCSECPAAQECPLPEALRDHAGSINSVDQAQEAWERAMHVKARVAAIEREVKTFARAHDVPIRVGDLEWRWEPTEGRAVKKAGRGSDWDGLVAALEETVQFGTPFDVTEWIQPTVGSSFKKQKVVNGNGGT